MPKRTNHARQTAAEAYAAARNDIARLLDVLDMELAKHEARAKIDGRNWGFAGDLQKVRRDLIETVGSISGMERNAVEGFLADAE
jgi:hypothetical protein